VFEAWLADLRVTDAVYARARAGWLERQAAEEATFVGVLADLEYSLRATATATEKSTFGMTSAKRAARMKKQLLEIQKLANDPLLNSALEAVDTVELRLGNHAAIAASADSVGKAANEFAEKADGKQLKAIDYLVPPPDRYRTSQINN